MNYEELTLEEAKKIKEELNANNQIDSRNLNAFDELHGGANHVGLVPDHIRELPERKELKKKFDQSFREMQKFNQWYVKTFVKKRRPLKEK